MTTLRTAAQQALEALEALHGGCTDSDDGTVEAITVWCPEVIDALRAALAEPVQEPRKFDHGIGADRFKVARGAYWWHVLIGDSPIKRGKFHTQAGAEEMAALLRREFRNGAFVQHEAALAEPQEPQCNPHPAAPHGFLRNASHTEGRYVCACEFWTGPVEQAHGQEPVAWRVMLPDGYQFVYDERMLRVIDEGIHATRQPLYTSPPQRLPLTEEEIAALFPAHLSGDYKDIIPYSFARAIERAHGIGGSNEQR